MNNAQKLKIYAENRKLIEFYSELKELATHLNDDNVNEALAHLDKATELLSEV